MAKYTRQLTGDFGTLLHSVEQGILGGSVSASLEDSADYQTGDVRVAVRVFERYSAMGANRVSLSVTLVGHGDNLFITGITSGGSQAVFFKINTFGEEAFLDRFREIVDRSQP
ncbi:MAG: hypothetical protein GX907_02945 [Clostridiaceae bacterium]|nr:hypothetical protein [Clostridiaceae bacterium]